MNIDTGKIYFRINNIKKDSEVYKILEDYKVISETRKKEVCIELKKFGLPAEIERTEFLSNGINGCIAGVQIKDYNFDRKVWKRIEKRFYAPRKNKMNETNYEFMMDVFNTEVPSILLFNLMMVKLDKKHLKKKSGLRSQYHQTDLISMLFEYKQYTYLNCSANFFRNHFNSFPEGLEIINVHDFTEAYTYAEALGMSDHIKSDKDFFAKNPSKIVIFNNDKFMIDSCGVIIDSFDISINDEKVFVIAKFKNTFISSDNINIDELLSCLDITQGEEITSIKYKGGSINNIGIEVKPVFVEDLGAKENNDKAVVESAQKIMKKVAKNLKEEDCDEDIVDIIKEETDEIIYNEDKSDINVKIEGTGEISE